MSRITGLATGLDVDAVVKETMQAYRTQIDTVGQEKALVELQQTMYREVITECRDFYNKYFDLGKPDSLLLSKNWATTNFTSSNTSVVTAEAIGTAQIDNYDVKVTQLASQAKYTIKESDLSNLNEIRIGAKDKDGKDTDVTIDLSNANSTNEKVSLINEELKKAGITGVSAKFSEFSKGIVISTTETGSDASFKIQTIDKSNKIQPSKTIEGKDCIAYLTNSKGETYRHEGASNSITLDGVKFTFSNTNATESSGNNDVNQVNVISQATLTGKTDTSAIKDKIVHFVNDYNKLIVKLNTLTSEKRNRDYMPLTDAQKKEMSEKEIELWEAKVKQGQLSRDSDLTRICNSMKKAMRDLVTGVSGDLEKFGIKPVADYSGNNNGTFSIDEDKLNSALENNIEDVKNIFISNGKDYKEKGIVYRLKEILDNETQKSSSSLLQKAGMEGSATASNNTLSRKITAYEKRIKELESNFARREQALYSKYATLETMMNNLNAQMSSLSSMFS